MMSAANYKLEIRLPEGVLFSLPLGGPVSRCLAFLTDICIISAVSTAFEHLVAPLKSFQEDFGAGILIVFYLAAWLLYGILCEYCWNGQTIGKWLLGLRVVDAAGLELQFYQVAIRNLIRSLDLLPLFGLVGGITMLCNRRLQRLGDLAAGTVVVRNRRPTTPNFNTPVKSRYNSLLQHQVLCARLRQRVPAQAAAVAFEALMRRDQLEDRARVLVFDELSAYFRAQVEFPLEDVDPLSSEQYVRNVVEVLYSQVRTRAPRMIPATN
ncbi:MAG: RDD family protein [Acidobacteriaceae bacterium]|nr:RDD family protein [Acidobacteriaceae bacterium]